MFHRLCIFIVTGKTASHTTVGLFKGFFFCNRQVNLSIGMVPFVRSRLKLGLLDAAFLLDALDAFEDRTGYVAFHPPWIYPESGFRHGHIISHKILVNAPSSTSGTPNG